MADILNQTNLLNTFLEGMGIEPEQLDKHQILQPLFEDRKHKMFEIVQEATKVMRHSKRDYLTSSDVKLAMQKLNINNIFGYPSYANQYEYQQMIFQNPTQAERSDEPAQTSAEPDQAVLWYHKPQQIDLREYIISPFLNTKEKSGAKLKNVPTMILPMTYDLHFTAINGVQPCIPENIQEKVLFDEEQPIQQESPSQDALAPKYNPSTLVVESSQKEIIKTDLTQMGEPVIEADSLLPNYIKSQRAVSQQQILNPTMLTKELDAYYHVYIHRFQKLETELQTHMLSSEEIIDFLQNEKP